MQAKDSCIYFAEVSALEDDALYSAALAQIPAQRRGKIDRLRFREDRCLSLGAGLLLQRALADAGLPCDPVIAAGEHGKPYLPEHSAFHFNLSHSGRVVACAVSSREIGCDVQLVERYNAQLATRFFSAEENALLKAQPTPAQEATAFFRLWTLKESYLKARGCGLSMPLNSFTVLLAPAAPLRDENGVLWALYELPFFEGCCCACCIRADKESAPPTVRHIDFSSDFCGSR